MALEIERRFLVRGDDWRRHALPPTQIRQGYLTTGAEALTLRVRLARPRGAVPLAFLTLKLPSPTREAPAATAVPAEAEAPSAAASVDQALERLEFEYPIPASDGEALLDLCGHRVAKTRFALDLPGGDWVLDVFADANAPLVVAEVELERADQPVPVPSWCFREITARRELSNAALAHRPLATWTAADREALLA